jgi:hypothetical protein
LLLVVAIGLVAAFIAAIVAAGSAWARVERRWPNLILLALAIIAALLLIVAGLIVAIGLATSSPMPNAPSPSGTMGRLRPSATGGASCGPSLARAC